MVGRVCGGISTSILFSAFESWMVTHFHLSNYPLSKLNDIFEHAWSLNSIIAVLAGVITSYAVKIYKKYEVISPPYEVAAFDCSAFVLMIAFVLIYVQWTENYGHSIKHENSTDIQNGDKNQKKSIISSMLQAFQYLKDNATICYLGMIQSLFESAMYIFVFVWTPTLENSIAIESRNNNKERILDYGWIFADFMISCLIGTLITSVMYKKHHWKSENICLLLIIISCFMMFLLITTQYYEIQLLSFLMFEVAVGMYFPVIGNLRSFYIPDEYRATIMNIFRIPLNLIVVAVLWYIDYLSSYIFHLCLSLLLLALFFTYFLSHDKAKNSPLIKA